MNSAELYAEAYPDRSTYGELPRRHHPNNKVWQDGRFTTKGSIIPGESSTAIYSIGMNNNNNNSNRSRDGSGSNSSGFFENVYYYNNNNIYKIFLFF